MDMDAIPSLKAVSLEGNIDALYSLLEDSTITFHFEQLNEKSFVENPIHVAARNGHTHFALEVMRLKPSFALKLNPQGLSPLHLAVQNGNTTMVLRLVEMNKELVRVQGKKGMTPLHCAAERGNLQILSALLRENLESLGDLTIRKQTPLHVALENNKIDCANFLLSGSWKKLLNLQDEDGNTPLHIATARNQVQIVKGLIDRQVDTDATNTAGLKASDVSEQSGNQVIKYLLKQYADRPPSIPKVYSSVNNYPRSLEDIAKRGNIKYLYTLIEEDPYLLDCLDEIPFVHTPLHIAAFEGHTKFCMEIMRLKPSFSRKPNQDGCTPLHLALENDQTDTVIRLVDADSDLIRVKGKEGKTALHWVAERGNTDLLETFLQACPRSIEDVTIQRKTALHIALENENFDSLDILVGKLRKADHENAEDQEKEILNKRDEIKETVLHIAARISNPQVVKLLLAARVEVNAMNSEGLTALDIVVRESQEHNQQARQAIGRMLLVATARNVIERILFSARSKQIIERMIASNASPPSEVQTQVNNISEFATPNSSQISLTSTTSTEYFSVAPSTTDLNNRELLGSERDYQHSKLSFLERFDVFLTRRRMQVSNDVRNILVVVAVLIAQSTYQFVVSPPGGVWQDNDNPMNNAAKERNNSGTIILSDHTAGLVIMRSIYFDIMYSFNTIVLVITIACIVFLLPRVFISFMLLVTLVLYLADYLLAVVIISPNSSQVFSNPCLLILLAVFGFIYIPIIYKFVARLSLRSLRLRSQPRHRRNDYGHHVSSSYSLFYGRPPWIIVPLILFFFVLIYQSHILF